MEGTLTLIFTISETRDIMTKISAFLQLKKNEFSSNLVSEAQKVGLTRLFDL